MKSEPFFTQVEEADRLMAVLYLLVGYGFIYAFTGVSQSYGLSIFTIFYGAVVLLYVWIKKKTPPAESWFWLMIMLAIGIPFAFWSVLYVFQELALMAVAAYWTLSVSGRLLDGRTSGWVFFDGWNALAIVPFGNFSCQIQVLLGKSSEADEEKMERQGIAVLMGILLSVPALFIILPLLSRADSGFERLAGNLALYIQDHLLAVFWRILFSIPVSSYLYGLIFGGINGRKTDRIKTEMLQKTRESIRRVPDTAVCTVLAILCGVYILFMGIQSNYLFSAFLGNLPEDFTYAEYARRGFFELCQLGTWNLILLGFVSLFSKSRSQKHCGLRFLTVLLSVLTLLLIITAMSKMGMYIRVYGLTVNRILPMVFMVWLMLVFVLSIIRQWIDFPIVRICVMVGAVLFCLLCVFPVENWIYMYNAWAMGV